MSGATKSGRAVVPLDDFLPYVMNRLMDNWNRGLNERLRAVNLTFQHWRVLLVLAHRGTRNLNQLVAETLVPQSTLSRVVDRMVRDGLVSRRTAKADSRAVKLALTGEGRAAFQRAYRIAFAEYQRAARPLGREGERRLIAATRLMAAAIE